MEHRGYIERVAAASHRSERLIQFLTKQTIRAPSDCNDFRNSELSPCLIWPFQVDKLIERQSRALWSSDGAVNSGRGCHELEKTPELLHLILDLANMGLPHLR